MSRALNVADINEAVQAVCAAVHTPSVVAAYQEHLAAADDV